MKEINICTLCEREVPEITDHHTTPRCRGGRQTVEICKDCHKQIHALFDNKRLAEDLNTIEAIRNDRQFLKYLKWIRKRPFGAVHKAKRSRETKRRGRKG
jgi:hypothetical protein